jgi:hypothetical protein
VAENGGGGSSGAGRRTYGPLWLLLGSLVGLIFSFFFSFSFYLFLSLALLRCLLVLLLLTREAQLIILKKVKEVVGKTPAATG